MVSFEFCRRMKSTHGVHGVRQCPEKGLCRTYSAWGSITFISRAMPLYLLSHRWCFEGNGVAPMARWEFEWPRWDLIRYTERLFGIRLGPVLSALSATPRRRNSFDLNLPAHRKRVSHESPATSHPHRIACLDGLCACSAFSSAPLRFAARG